MHIVKHLFLSLSIPFIAANFAVHSVLTKKQDFVSIADNFM